MKKIFTVLLAAALVLSLAACGSKSGSPDQDAPDLNRYFEDFMSGLGEENAPAMMDLEGQYLEAAYPGLSAYQTKQCVVKPPVGRFALEYCECGQGSYLKTSTLQKLRCEFYPA